MLRFCRRLTSKFNSVRLAAPVKFRALSSNNLLDLLDDKDDMIDNIDSKYPLLKMYPAPETRRALKEHRCTLVFLHGLGDTGLGWVDELRSHAPDFFKIVCPTAQVHPVTLNFGMSSTSWFDLLGMDPDSPQDEANIALSSQYLVQLAQYEAEVANIPIENVVIGGFSQGAVVTYYTLLTSGIRFKGALMLSGYLPLAKKFLSGEIPLNNPHQVKRVPCYALYGGSDPLIPPAYMSHSVQILKNLEMTIDEQVYMKMGHTAEQLELKHIYEYLLNLIEK